MKGALPLLLLALVVSANNAAALSSPWYQASARIRAALASDKYVESASQLLGKKLELTVTVASCCKAGRRLEAATNATCIDGCKAAKNKAAALSTLLWAATNKNNDKLAVKVQIRVMQDGLAVLPGKAPTSSGGAAGLLTKAMLGNNYFISVESRSPFPMDATRSIRYAVFQPAVVQYFSDDISQKDGLTSVLAADLMESVFRLTGYGMGVNTNKCNGEDCVFPVSG